MRKTFVNSLSEYQDWRNKTEEKRKNSFNRPHCVEFMHLPSCSRTVSPPEFPCVVVWDIWYPDSATVRITYLFVTQEDFIS